MKFHKYVNSDDPNNYIHAKVTRLIPTHNHNTRFCENENINLPHINKTIVQKQFFYNSVNEWNKIPLGMRKLVDANNFKYELRNYLLLNN